jgi:S-formylglutathione hydrolase FrmB
METSLTILTPNNIHPGGKFKVIYLLHGICGRSGDWVDYTMLPTYASNYNVIFIMPEVARSFYANMKYGFKYFDYITQELPELIKRVFNIAEERNDTAIIGASMGGYGALKCALTYPEKYGYCCAFSSPCLFLKEDLQKAEGAKRFKEFYGEQLFGDFQAVFGENIEFNPQNDILTLVEKCNAQELRPQIYMACGTEDFFYNSHNEFQKVMGNFNFEFTYESWQGDHDWFFFNDALKKAFEFCFK